MLQVCLPINREKKLYQLNGKTVLVTGAAGGIGRNVACRLAQEGCDVGLFDIDEAGAKETVSLIEKSGQRGRFYWVDVGSFEAVKSNVDLFIKDFGKIDILINSAGIVKMGSVAETPVELWQQVFRINVDGTFNLCKAVVPYMINNEGGKIINTSSWLGKSGAAKYGAYSASKFAIIGLTQALASELAPVHINVNAICPGIIGDTGMRTEVDAQAQHHGLSPVEERITTIPLGRLGKPSDVANVVAFLVSDQSDYMTGQAINITGGLWR